MSILEKVIDLDKSEKQEDGIGVLANIIKKRDDLKQEIEKKLSSDKNTDIDSDKEESVDEPKDKDVEEESVDEPRDKDVEEESTKEPKDKDNEEESPMDDFEKSFDDDFSKKDKDTDKKDDDKSDKKDDGPKTGFGASLDKAMSSESIAKKALITIRKLSSENFFQSYIDEHTRYLDSLKSFSISKRIKHISVENQPVVYTKDKMIESLKKILNTANVYDSVINEMFMSLSSSLKEAMETITIYKTYKEQNKITFTNKLIDNKDILINLYSDINCDFKSSLRIMDKFNTDTITLIKFLLTNELNTITGILKTANFILNDNGEYNYKDKLPGFNLVTINITEYNNYIKTILEEYSCHSIKNIKPTEMLSLDALAIKDEQILDYVNSYLTKIITSMAIITDTMKDVNKTMNETFKEVKLKIYDLENNKVTDMPSLNIDKTIKDIIKLKLALESILVNISISSRFITSSTTVLKESVTF